MSETLVNGFCKVCEQNSDFLFNGSATSGVCETCDSLVKRDDVEHFEIISNGCENYD